MDLKRLHTFMCNPRRIPYYLFPTMVNKWKKESIEHAIMESKGYVAGTQPLPPVLSSADWKKLQTSKFFESWDKSISEDIGTISGRFGHDSNVLSPKRTRMDDTRGER